MVQPMAEPGVELLMGVVHDESFGPVIACGAGGTRAELLGDVAVRITPLTDLDASEMLRSLRTFPLLDGYRGAPALRPRRRGRRAAAPQRARGGPPGGRRDGREPRHRRRRRSGDRRRPHPAGGRASAASAAFAVSAAATPEGRSSRLARRHPADAPEGRRRALRRNAHRRLRRSPDVDWEAIFLAWVARFPQATRHHNDWRSRQWQRSSNPPPSRPRAAPTAPCRPRPATTTSSAAHWVAPVDGEYRENLTPATGQPFCEVAHSGAAGHRAGARRRPRRQGRLGRGLHDGTLEGAERGRGRDRGEPRDARRGRELGERQAGARDARRGHPARGRPLPLLRRRDPRRGGTDLGDRQGHRRLPLLRAARRGRPDHPVQLPAADGSLEDRAGARGRQLHGRQAGLAYAVVDPQARGGHPGDRPARAC